MPRIPLVLLAGLPLLAVLATPAAAADPVLQLTAADNGRVIDVAPGTEVQVDLTPQRAADVWHVGGSGRGLDVHAVSEGSDHSTLRARVNAGSTLSAQTDAACTHAASPCGYAPQTWSVQLTVPAGPVPDNPASEPCTSQPAQPAPGVRVVTTADDGRGVTVHQGDVVLVDLPCSSSADPFTIPVADGPLFRAAVTASSDLHAVQARFTTESTGRTTVSWGTDVRCTPSQGQIYCFGRPSRLYRVQVTVVAPDAPIDPTADQCVQSFSAPNLATLPGSTVPLTGQADPGATVRVYFRRHGQSSFSLRRTLLADSTGRFATSYVADAPYTFYAAAGTACQTYPQQTVLRPRVSGPAAVTRGSTVTVRVLGQPGSTIQLAFRRRGASTFVVRRTAHLDGTGSYTTTYRADADYRYQAHDTTLSLDGNTGLTQIR